MNLNIKNINTISIYNCKISISRLENITPKDISSNSYKILPKIKLTDLIIDIA